ncbi:hypothetical protein MKZ38_008120 [Zalerion maritima]|uniref:Uncharacterized protein n=1 Tax=Zalerion maritima TaxID=339359 RepID=A0AAD5RHD0_9PEZI|nr:hypothetical protein MKZ38_008120 [Zalerion maritima]
MHGYAAMFVTPGAIEPLRQHDLNELLVLVSASSEADMVGTWYSLNLAREGIPCDGLARSIEVASGIHCRLSGGIPGPYWIPNFVSRAWAAAPPSFSARLKPVTVVAFFSLLKVYRANIKFINFTAYTFFSSNMSPHLITIGKIQILGEPSNSVVYAVDTDSKTELARDIHTVLKGGTVWYNGLTPLGDKIDNEEIDCNLWKEADLYKAIGSHPCIVSCYGLELLKGTNWPWHCAWSAGTNLRRYIVENARSPPDITTRVHIAA